MSTTDFSIVLMVGVFLGFVVGVLVGVLIMSYRIDLP